MKVVRKSDVPHGRQWRLPAYLREHRQAYEHAVAYAPRQTFIGNIPPLNLWEMPFGIPISVREHLFELLQTTKGEKGTWNWTVGVTRQCEGSRRDTALP